MKSTQGHPWFLRGMCIIINRNSLVLSTYCLGNQVSLPFTVLMLFRILITPRISSYSSLKILYGFTIYEICSLHLLSLLQTYPSKTFMLLYRASCVWCIGWVYKTWCEFGIKLVLKRGFSFYSIFQSNEF